MAKIKTWFVEFWLIFVPIWFWRRCYQTGRCYVFEANQILSQKSNFSKYFHNFGLINLQLQRRQLILNVISFIWWKKLIFLIKILPNAGFVLLSNCHLIKTKFIFWKWISGFTSRNLFIWTRFLIFYRWKVVQTWNIGTKILFSEFLCQITAKFTLKTWREIKLLLIKSILSLKTVNKQLNVQISALRLSYTGQSQYEIWYIQLFVYRLYRENRL